MFSNYNRIDIEINDRKKCRKFPNIWKLNNMLLNNARVQEDITRKVFKK